MRKDTYEGTWLYYVELAVKGAHKKESRVTTKKRVQFEETGVGSMDLPDDVGFDDDEGPGEADMEKIEEQEDRENTNRKGKALGLPELDPDALPSSMAQKYLMAVAKRMKKMQDLSTKFSSASNLTEIQQRLQASINQSISAMEKVHRDMSNDYSTGVASGYTKKLEASLREKLETAQQLATSSLGLEARSRPFVPKSSEPAQRGNAPVRAKAKARPKPSAKAKAKASAVAKVAATPPTCKRVRRS